MDDKIDNDPHFIVAELTKNWQDGTGTDDLAPISVQFEAILNYNHGRGYQLLEWKYSATMTGDDSMMETIIAIFKRVSPATNMKVQG